MELLQQSKAIFYHPLNDSTEYLKTQDWDETTPAYLEGKVSDALWPTAEEFGAIAFGMSAEFNSGNTLAISLAALSSTVFVAAYRDLSDSSHGTARVGTVSGTTVTFGAEAEFLSAGAIGFTSPVAALSATKFVVAYQDQADGYHGTAKVGTVSGTSVTFGAESEFLSTSIDIVSAAALSATAFVVAYNEGTNDGASAKVGTVSGTDITFGAEAKFVAPGESSYASSISVTTLSATAVVVAYRDLSNSSHGTARVGTVSGTAITFGAEAEFNSAITTDISVAALSATKFVVAYRDAADSNHGTAKVGTVSGTAITFGAEAEFLSADGAERIVVAALDSAIIPPASATKFVVAYMDLSDSNHGTARVGTVSGTDITFGAEAEYFGTGDATINSATALGTAKFVVATNADSISGVAKVGTPPPAASLVSPTPGEYDSAAAATKVAFCGWFRKPSA